MKKIFSGLRNLNQKKSFPFTGKTLLSRRYLVDRSFRLANVTDLYVAQSYKDRITNEHLYSFQITADIKYRDMSKQIVIDLSHEQGYRRGHIPGSVNLPVEKFDFTRQVDVYGGIMLEEVTEVMKNIGVSDTTSEIILYDNSGLLACRLWFVLRYFGFRNVRILNGGWKAWLKSGLPVSEEIAQVKPSSKLTLKPKRTKVLVKPSQMIFDYEHKTSHYVDTRHPEAYTAYHIDGAVNIPSRDLMADSKFASVHEIRDRVQQAGVSLENKTIVYSSKSLTSSVGLFAFLMAGGDHVALYDAGLQNWRNCFDDRLSLDTTDYLSR